MIDDFDVNQVEKESIEEMFKRHDEEWRKEHPFYHWFDNFFYNRGIKSLSSFAPHVIFSDPIAIIKSWRDEVKWASQRVIRKYDDRATWSVDYWLDSIMPDILITLKMNGHGIPVSMYDGMPHDENYEYDEDADKEAKERWDAELDKMIDGFVASKKLCDLDYNFKDDKERDALEKVHKGGMESFVKHYHSLWD
jgi:hypothetical protein